MRVWSVLLLLLALAAPCGASAAADRLAQTRALIATASQLAEDGRFEAAATAARAAQVAAAGEPRAEAEAQLAVAERLVDADRISEARPALIDAARKLAAAGPNDRVAAKAAVEAALVLGMGADGDPAAAITASDAPLARLNRLSRTAEERAEAATFRGRRAAFMFDAGRWREAEAEIRATLATLAEPGQRQGAAQVTLLNSLANGFQSEGRFDDAMAQATKALQAGERSVRSDHPVLIDPLSTLAVLLSTQGDDEAAEPMLRRAVAIAQANYPHGGEPLAYTLAKQGDYYLERERYDEAEALYRRAIAIYEQNPDTLASAAETYQGLALELDKQGKFEQAQAAAERALALSLKSSGLRTYLAGQSHLIMARIAYDQKQNDKGEAYARKGLEVYRASLAADNPRIGDALSLVALAAQRRDDKAAAVALYKQAEALSSRTRAAGDQRIISMRFLLAQQIYRQHNDPAGAYGYARRAADALQDRTLSNAHMLGHQGAPNLSNNNRYVFVMGVRAGWDYAALLKKTP